MSTMVLRKLLSGGEIGELRDKTHKTGDREAYNLLERLITEVLDARAMVRSLDGLLSKHGCPKGATKKYEWLDARLTELAQLKQSNTDDSLQEHPNRTT